MFRDSTMCKIVILFLISTLSLLRPTVALFEDQVGKFDWRQQFIGQVAEVGLSLPRPNYPAPQTLLLSTRSAVLASLYLRNGSIAWRHYLETGISAIAAGRRYLFFAGFFNKKLENIRHCS